MARPTNVIASFWGRLITTNNASKKSQNFFYLAGRDEKKTIEFFNKILSHHHLQFSTFYTWRTVHFGADRLDLPLGFTATRGDQDWRGFSSFWRIILSNLDGFFGFSSPPVLTGRFKPVWLRSSRSRAFLWIWRGEFILQFCRTRWINWWSKTLQISQVQIVPKI